jgi:hypothetical protein
MLAGHPRLCAASELNLLGFDTLGERRDAFQGPSSVFLDGVLRFLMDVHGFTADEAVERMHAAESDDLPVCELYHDLQRAIAPRLLLDKSPAYGLNPAALAHAEHIFDGALYVHLSRHPHSTMRSFAEHHMEQVYFNHDGFTARQAAELVWSLTHANVRNFLRTVPAARQAHVRYEDLVTQPERTVRALCSTIGLEFDAELLHPYRNKDRKIPSGLRPDSKPLGDPKFHSFEGITTEPLNVGHHEADDAPCGPITVSLAGELGYEVHGGDTQPSSRASRDITEHTRAQQIRDRLAQRRGLRRREPLAAPSSIS